MDSEQKFNQKQQNDPSSGEMPRETAKQQPVEKNEPIPPILEDTKQRLLHLFANCDDFVFIPWHYGPDLQYKALAVYTVSMVPVKRENYFKTVMQDLVTHQVGPAMDVTIDDVIYHYSRKGPSAETAEMIEHFDVAILKILSGCVVVFFDGWDRALSFISTTLETRQVTEPITEPVVRGPHDSTVEDLNNNIGLLRNRLKTPDFKIELFHAGGKTNTEIAYGYLNGAVNPETLAEFKQLIAPAKEMEILETAYIEELLEDSGYSPFPRFRWTERPDSAVAALLDGKIVVLVSGSPAILICPGLFVEFLQSPEDYYNRTDYASLKRLVRLVALFISVTLPSIYIALTTFHPELIPTVLLLAILNTREGIPFPAFVEALIMEFFFELLREAGIRLPRPIGSAVSIVGALVIGESAINAGIASPAMVVVVALTGIASFSVPQYNFGITARMLRFPLMILAATLGGFGLMIGFLLILVHIFSLRSLGQPYMAPLGPLRPRQLRDVFIRAPLKLLFRSPRNRYRHKPLTEVGKKNSP